MLNYAVQTSNQAEAQAERITRILNENARLKVTVAKLKGEIADLNHAIAERDAAMLGMAGGKGAWHKAIADGAIDFEAGVVRSREEVILARVEMRIAALEACRVNCQHVKGG